VVTLARLAGEEGKDKTMAGTHSGAAGNPPVMDRAVIGTAVASLFECGGVEPDGANLEKVFVMTVTDDGFVHMKALNMHPAEVLMAVLQQLDAGVMPIPLSGGMLGALLGGPGGIPQLPEISDEEIAKLLAPPDGTEGTGS